MIEIDNKVNDIITLLEVENRKLDKITQEISEEREERIKLKTAFDSLENEVKEVLPKRIEETVKILEKDIKNDYSESLTGSINLLLQRIEETKSELNTFSEHISSLEDKMEENFTNSKCDLRKSILDLENHIISDVLKKSEQMMVFLNDMNMTYNQENNELKDFLSKRFENQEKVLEDNRQQVKERFKVLENEIKGIQEEIRILLLNSVLSEIE